MGYAWSQEDETIAVGFLRIATEQLAKSVLNADAVGTSPAKRIHSARRHCKRLRGLFRLVRADFPAYRHANAAVRDAADRLSAVRDAAVLRDTLEELYTWAGQPVPAAPADATVSPASEEAALHAFRADISHLLGDAENWKTGKIDRETLIDGFGRGYHKAAEAAADCRDKPSDDAFHDWRKQVKYHSFHLILLKGCLAGTETFALEPVEHLAALLGRHHDLAVLRQTVRDNPDALGSGIDPDFVATNSERLQDLLGSRAFGIAESLFARPSKAVRQSVDSHWRAWWQPATAAEPA